MGKFVLRNKLRKIRADWPLLVAGLLSGMLIWNGNATVQAEKEPASPPRESSTLDAEVENALTHLLDLTRSGEKSFRPDRIHALVEYAVNGQTTTASDTPSPRFGGAGAIVTERIEAPLGRIQRVLYNPNIPSYLAMPKMLRLSGWHAGSDLVTRSIALWETDPATEGPLMLHGREFEVTTPDKRSGGYYHYDLDRLIVFFSDRSRPVMISVSRSVEPSEVGKRAFIIDEKNWAYFYSEDIGLSLNMLQWMETYIYETASVMIFHANEKDRRTTGVTLFKWLNAGWLGMNMVREAHIRQGSRRSVEHLKQIVESDAFPAPEALERRYARVRSLPEQDLDRLIRSYAEHIERAAGHHAELSGSEYGDDLRNGGYARLLDRQERIGAVMVEYLKKTLGKKPLIRPDLLESMLTEHSTDPTLAESVPATGEFTR